MPAFFYEWAAQLRALPADRRTAALGAMPEDDRLTLQRILDQEALARGPRPDTLSAAGGGALAGTFGQDSQSTHLARRDRLSAGAGAAGAAGDLNPKRNFKEDLHHKEGVLAACARASSEPRRRPSDTSDWDARPSEGAPGAPRRSGSSGGLWAGLGSASGPDEAASAVRAAGAEAEDAHSTGRQSVSGPGVRKYFSAGGGQAGVSGQRPESWEAEQEGCAPGQRGAGEEPEADLLGLSGEAGAPGHADSGSGRQMGEEKAGQGDAALGRSTGEAVPAAPEADLLGLAGASPGAGVGPGSAADGPSEQGRQPGVGLHELEQGLATQGQRGKGGTAAPEADLLGLLGGGGSPAQATPDSEPIAGRAHERVDEPADLLGLSGTQASGEELGGDGALGLGSAARTGPMRAEPVHDAAADLLGLAGSPRAGADPNLRPVAGTSAPPASSPARASVQSARAPAAASPAASRAAAAQAPDADFLGFSGQPAAHAPAPAPAPGAVSGLEELLGGGGSHGAGAPQGASPGPRGSAMIDFGGEEGGEAGDGAHAALYAEAEAAGSGLGQGDEPEARRVLRARRRAAMHERMRAGLAEKTARDAAEAGEAEKRAAAKEAVAARMAAWQVRSSPDAGLW